MAAGVGGGMSGFDSGVCRYSSLTPKVCCCLGGGWKSQSIFLEVFNFQPILTLNSLSICYTIITNALWRIQGFDSWLLERNENVAMIEITEEWTLVLILWTHTRLCETPTTSNFRISPLTFSCSSPTTFTSPLGSSNRWVQRLNIMPCQFEKHSIMGYKLPKCV